MGYVKLMIVRLSQGGLSNTLCNGFIGSGVFLQIKWQIG